MATPTLTSDAINVIWRERAHQIAKGFDAEHDDRHTRNELLNAAFIFDTAAIDGAHEAQQVDLWPWEPERFKPRETPLDNLIVAAAFYVAEIERRLRAGERPTP